MSYEEFKKQHKEENNNRINKVIVFLSVFGMSAVNLFMSMFIYNMKRTDIAIMLAFIGLMGFIAFRALAEEGYFKGI